jgi:methylated-DNA-protein-cysteine methyltransferase-like protein
MARVTPQTAPISRAKIYAVIRRVPRGRVTTYGDIATLAGYPGHARQVGYALHALPPGSVVPWHRVINSAGRLSLPPGGGGTEQQLRLVAEGVLVQPGGRVNLTTYRWRPAPRRGR